MNSYLKVILGLLALGVACSIGTVAYFYAHSQDDVPGAMAASVGWVSIILGATVAAIVVTAVAWKRS